MTREEFTCIALNPPKAEGKTIFVVTEIDLGFLPDTRRNRYPKFRVYRRTIGYCDSLLEAEKLMRQAITLTGDINDIYCFHVNEHLINRDEPAGCDGISWCLYSNDGELIDHSWFDSSGYPDIKFRGRPRSSIRFGAGEIVEVLRGDEVRLAVATQSPIDIDWCWNLRERIAKRLKERGEDVTDEILEQEYFVDDTDDQAAVIDGPGYEYHEHIPTQCIMPLRYRLSERLRKRYDGYWQACLKQDEEFRQQNKQ